MDGLTDISIVTERGRTSLGRRILPDILAFATGLALAYHLEWETTDLVWSLWLCSLVLGYTTILAAIGGGAYILANVVRHVEPVQRYRKPVLAGGIGIGFFLFGFFSLHFCGFHAGHSVFLNQFFPVEGMPKDGFGAAFMNPPLLWKLVFTHLLQPYGIFIIPALIAERKHVFRPLARAIELVQVIRGGDSNIKESNFDAVSVKTKGQRFFHDMMGRPYINVVRMHLLIFFFAISHFMKMDSFIIYAVVYAVYFFPWGEILDLRKRHLPTGTSQ